MKLKFLTIFMLFNLTVGCALNITDYKSPPLNVFFSKVIEDEGIDHLEYSEDGQTILTASDYGNIHILTRQNLKSVVVIEFDDILANARAKAHILDNGKKIFMADHSGYAQIWDLRSKKRLFSYQFPKGEKLADISDDANYIAYGGYVYDRSVGVLLKKDAAHAVQTALTFLDKKNVLSAGFWDQSIVLRDLNNNTFDTWVTEDEIPSAAALRNFIIAGTTNGECIIWKVPDKEPFKKVKGPGFFNFISIFTDWTDIIATHPQKLIFAAVWGKHTCIYQLEPFKKLLHLKSNSEIRAVAISNNDLIALGDVNGTVAIWDINKGVPIGRHKMRGDDSIISLAFNPKREEILVGTYNGQISVLTAAHK